jgi:hypothetical protein
MPSMSDPGWERIDMGLGVYILYKFASATEIDFQLWFESVELAQGSASELNSEVQLHVDVDIARADLVLTVQPYLGQVLAAGDVQIWEDNAWKTVAQFSNDVLVLYDPTKGVVAGDTTPHPPQVPPQPWGASWFPSGGITRFYVTNDVRVATDIGSRVKKVMFPGYPPLVFNTIACCGKPAAIPNGPGVYGDPQSIWFNIFFGGYEMSCLKSDGWTRPFGYESAAGINSVIHGEDIERLGKSDWNWFSNYMYGVPAEVCERYSDIGKAAFGPTATVTLGSSQWHVVSLSNVTVASTYQSDAKGAQQLQENSVLTSEWRDAFGHPCPRPDYTTSFIPTTLKATLFMSYSEDTDGFYTVMFGGTSGVKADPAFLAAQVKAAQETIVLNYPKAGFPLS